MEMLRAAIAVLVGIIAHVAITAKRMENWKYASKKNPIPDFIVNVLSAELIAIGAWVLMNIEHFL